MSLFDTKYNFIAVDLGAYGKSSNSKIFTNFNLGKAIEQDKLQIPQKLKLSNTSTKYPNVIVKERSIPIKNIFNMTTPATRF